MGNPDFWQYGGRQGCGECFPCRNGSLTCARTTSLQEKVQVAHAQQAIQGAACQMQGMFTSFDKQGIPHATLGESCAMQGVKHSEEPQHDHCSGAIQQRANALADRCGDLEHQLQRALARVGELTLDNERLQRASRR